MAQVAQADEDFIVKEKKKAEEAYRRKVTTLFRQVDTSGDGKIDVHEFKRLLKAQSTCWGCHYIIKGDHVALCMFLVI